MSYKLEFAMNEEVDDVLKQLEKDLQNIESYQNEKNEIDFRAVRVKNKIDVYGVRSILNEHLMPVKVKPYPIEALTFEVSKIRKNDKGCLIRTFIAYDDISNERNLFVEKLYYTCVARLGYVFDTEWKKEAKEKLEEIETEMEKGQRWQYWSYRNFPEMPELNDTAQVDAESITSHQENLSLVCDKREFRTWFEHQYPNHAKYYKDAPEGAIFYINLTRFDLVFTNDNGKHQYAFTITEPRRFSKIRQDFIGTIRNTFGSTMPQIGAVKDTKQHGKSGRPHLSEDIWAWEQVNIYNRPRTEVYREWLEREDVKGRNLQDPERQFDRITKPEWGNK